jgi:T5SS/PEP-CTERM-associated repeat protein
LLWLATASLAPFFILPSAARADSYYFVHAGGGDFNSSSDPYVAWFDTTVPANVNLPPGGADAFIARSGTVGVSGVTVNQNAIYNVTSLNSLNIDNQNVLSQTSAASVMMAASEIVAVSAVGSFNLAAGSNSAGFIYVGDNSGAVGTFNQSGGTDTASGLYVGSWGGSSGTYTLSGGTLFAATVTLGWFGGNGTFAQSGGTANVGVLDISTGGANGGIGNYNLSGGTLNVTASASVGLNQIGRFTQTGGTHLASTLFVGDAPTGNGTYTLSGTGLLTVSNSAYIGNFGTGNFAQIAGTFNVNGSGSNGLFLGFATGSIGNYTLGGGTLNVTNNEYIGYGGIGVFTQTAGTHLIGGTNNTLFVGYNAGASGTYTLAGTGSLAPGYMQIGWLGNGNFIQSGGSNNIAQDALIGSQLGSSGTYTLSGGSFTVGGQLIVGEHANGTFNQTGGSANVNFLTLGRWLDGGSNVVGTYNLSSGAYLTSVGDQWIGSVGNGAFNQTGGSNTVGGSLQLGWSDSGTSHTVGTYNLSGGNLTAPSESVGWGGVGVFTQSGGANTITQTGTSGLGIGYLPSGNGTYTLSGGVLNTGATIYVGNGGTGTLNISGGSLTVGNGHSITIGNFAGSSGTVNLSGGTVVLTGSHFVGGSGNGVMNQTGGSLSVANFQYIGSQPGAVGVYNLSGTASTLSVALSQYVGESGSGVFNQSGGTNNPGLLSVGHQAGSTGTYTLSGFASILNSTTSEFVGDAGTGTFIQFAGFNTIAQTLEIARIPGSSGSYALSAGLLNVLGGEFVGEYGAGYFSQFGGGHSVGGGLTIAANLGSSGRYDLFGGGLLADVSNNGVFNQTGGVFNGTFNNFGSYTFGGGFFHGLFVQQLAGQFSIAPVVPVFQARGGFTLYGTISIDSSHTILGGTGGTNPAGVDIEGGFLDLAGGTLGGGPILNNGTLSGFGTLGGSGFTNNAVITQTGEFNLATTGSVVNNGAMNLAAGKQLVLTGTSLVNAGTINLTSAQVTGGNALINSYAGVVIGPGMIAAPFANNGSIVVPSGSLNVAQPWANAGSVQVIASGASLGGGAIVNSGIISLSAVGASIGSASINNVGRIQGFGTIASPQLINAGTIAPSGGGTLAVTGTIFNPSPGLIRISGGNDFLAAAGLAVNLGTIDLQGGTFDNNNKPLANAGIITGCGALSTGGLTNTPGQVITFTGGLATVNGPVTNAAGATIRASYYPVLFAGPVVNNGTIKVSGAPTNTVTFASSYGGSGLYFSDPADNYFQDINVTPGGQVVGATGDHFFIAGTYVNAGTYSNDGGTLAGQNVINQGSFNQLAGAATMLALSGTGAATVGGGAAGTAIASVYSLSQGALTINSGGTLTIRPAGTRFTNAATNLQINGTGTLDLSNHELLTSTDPATIKSYLANAYDPSGNADWGQHGLTSSVAKGNPTSYSIGYAYGGDQSSQDAGVTTKNGTPLGASQTIIRPILVGDANMDGVVDFFDITQILGYKYNTNQPASYTDGDLDYSGHVDFFDIVLLLSANYNSGQTYLGANAHAAAPTLTRGAAIPSSTTIGTPGDGKPDFEYNPQTGDLKFRTDGTAFTTTGGSASFVSSLTISSATGILLPGGASSPFAGGTGATLTSTLLSSALTNSPGFSDGFDIGLVLAPGLGAAALTADLTVKYQSLNGGSLKTADITVPEPTGLAILALGGAAALVRRRRRRGVGIKKCARDAISFWL